jgi:hypothetical protein
VIDYETRKPVEGAVAIAIWRGHLKDCTLPQSLEGGCWGVTKIVETVSDKDGNIFIDGFWNWGQVEKPRLTVYKFGYVCWDQKQVFSMKGPRPMRIDFNKDNRTVWLEKWPEGFSFREHSNFENSITNGDSSILNTPLFYKAFRSEDPYISKELNNFYSTKKK